VRILTRKILTDLLLNFLWVLLVLLSFLLLGNFVRMALKMPDFGMGMVVLGGRMVWVLLPYSLSVAWAPACLAAGLVTFGGMSSEGELETAVCSGLSRVSLISPAFPLAVLASLGGFYLHTEARPWARKERNKLVRMAEIQLLPLMAESDQRKLTELVPGLRIDLSAISGNRFFAPRIWRLRNGQPDTITARSGSFQLDKEKGQLRLVFEDGALTIGKSRQPSTYERVLFEEFTMTASMGAGWKDRALLAVRPKDMSVEDLKAEIQERESASSMITGDTKVSKTAQREKNLLVNYRFVVHNKYALGISGGLFLLLGVGLGFVTERNHSSPAMLQVGLTFACYHGLMLWFHLGVGTYGAAAPYVVWIPNGLIVIVIALLFSRRM
jgi:lipopolysaccharide export LptBFGC system permease protein LptF